MQTVLLVIHLLLALALVGVILIQRSEGGGLGIGGGGAGAGFMTARGAANALTRATAWLAGLFMVTSIALAIIASRGAAPQAQRSILDQPTAPASSVPAAPSVPVAK
ncbi:preprotein translocase subunit SecG [Lacibacterium aquatile]|uniref:Protein-export membrane protein SecG n=1 Tax=Lacibacterium aquatile TaxID=1168082 RepID=A0ABW5DQF0_9PROT